MALIGEQDAQFLLMIGASLGFFSRFNQHHAEALTGIKRFEKGDVQLVVGQPHPPVHLLKVWRPQTLAKRSGALGSKHCPRWKRECLADHRPESRRSGHKGMLFTAQ
jgi:hypothetical protein